MHIGQNFISHLNGEHYEILRINNASKILICLNKETGEHVMFRETFFVNNFEEDVVDE